MAHKQFLFSPQMYWCFHRYVYIAVLNTRVAWFTHLCSGWCVSPNIPSTVALHLYHALICPHNVVKGVSRLRVPEPTVTALSCWHLVWADNMCYLWKSILALFNIAELLRGGVADTLSSCHPSSFGLPWSLSPQSSRSAFLNLLFY